MNSSSAARVPEPGSRTMNPSPSSARAGTLSARANGCSTEVTNPCGCIAKGSAREGQFLGGRPMMASSTRSEEHTSELQSRLHLVCRLLLEKKKHRIGRTILVLWSHDHEP